MLKLSRTQSPRTPEREHSGLLLRAGTLMFFLASMLAIFAAIECHTAVSRTQPSVSLTPSLLYGAVLWLWWAPVAQLLWKAGGRYPAILHFSVRNVAAQIIVGLAIACLHLLTLQETVHLLVRTWPKLWEAGYNSLSYLNVERGSLELLVYTILWAVCAAIASQISAQRGAMNELALKEQLAAAQLHALQMQLEPHFLFNTLNAVGALVDLKRNEEASQMLEHLDTLLRSGLQRSAPQKILFQEELRIVESYLAIQKVRFADRLEVTIETTPEALTGLVPCFLLQPIVENAIHHGIAPMKTGGIIEASIRREGDKLWMQVRDNGAGPGHASKGHGIGLRNIRERLMFFYPEVHEFAAEARESGGYEVTIQIPFEQATV
jgi:signal transduction histidine kinase